MQDCGARKVVDFTYFGHPSTYMLGEEELLGIFHSVDMKYGNNPRNYLVLEFADGISGVCSSSPLAIREIRSFSHIPILKSIESDYKAIYSLIR